MKKKTIRTKRGINPYTGAILTVPTESVLEKELKQLEIEVLQASKNAMEDVQEDLIWSARQQERAKEILKQERH